MKKIALTTFLFGSLLACGTTPSGSITDIAIEATKVVLKDSQSTVLTATVSGTGTFNNALTWAIETGGGGTLSSSSGGSTIYTAPNKLLGGVVRVTASSVQNPSQKKTIYLGVHPQRPSIAAGYDQALAIKQNSTVLAWGDDFYGQLGDAGTNTDQAAPVAVAEALGIVAVSAGEAHSLALKSDGTVWAWGDDAFGQLGDGDVNTDKNSPVVVPGASGIVAISAGGYHSLALKSDGTLLAWGQDDKGQLGDGGTNTNKFTPVAVSGASGIVAIAGGGKFSLALKSDGTVLAWGSDQEGQLGDGGTNTDKSTPVAVSGASGIVAIAAEDEFALALKSDGTVLAWGSDQEGQLGDGGTNSNKTTPVAVSGASGIVAIAAGAFHALALKQDGTLLAWGYDEQGQLGDGGTNTNKTTPVAVSGASGIVAIDAGGYFSLALKADTTMLAWGYDGDGQLGDGGTNTNQATPVAVALGAATIYLP
jgi:alpha-tubulin suppressor-like RCC1 family protein